MMEAKGNTKLHTEQKDAVKQAASQRIRARIPGDVLEDMGRAGREMVRTAQRSLSGQDTLEQAGERKLRRYGLIASDTVALMGALGGHAAAELQKAKSDTFAEGAVNAERLLARGVLKKSDLKLPKKELKKKLDNEHVKTRDRWGILANAFAIHDAVTVKEELVKLKNSAADPAHLYSRTRTAIGTSVPVVSRVQDESNTKILTSDAGRFYHDFRYGKNSQIMIDVWFQMQGDSAIRHLRPAQMNRREIRKLLKNRERYHLSDKETAMLRVLLSAKTAGRERAMGRAFDGIGGRIRSLREITRRGAYLAEQVDDVSLEGVQRLATIYSGVRTVEELVHLAARGGVMTAQAVHRSPPAKAVRRGIARGIQTFREIPAVRIRRETPGQSSVRTIRPRFRTSDHRVPTLKARPLFTYHASGMVRTVDPRPGVMTDPIRSIRGRVRRIRRSAPVRETVFVTRRLRDAVRLTLFPARAAGRSFAKAMGVMKKITAALCAVVFAVLLLFLLLLLFSAFITSIGKSTGEIIEGVITDGELKDHIDHLNDRNRERFAEAEAIGKGRPRHDAEHIDEKGLYPDEALYGVKLYHYGSPKTRWAADVNLYHNDLPGETTGGVRYFYLNSRGEEIANGMTNTKDILALTSVMVGNDYDEEVVTIAPGLMDQWFELLNPEPVYTVSEIYHAEGSDVFMFDGMTYNGENYVCTDGAFYDAYQDARAQGVKFYELPHAQTEKGCRLNWDAYEADRDAWYERRPEHPEYPERDDFETREEWLEAVEAYYEATERYWEDYDAWYDERPDYDDYRHCPGHPAVRCSYGYRDVHVYVTILTKEDVYEAAENGGILTWQVPADYAGDAMENRSASIDISADLTTRQFYRNDGWRNPKHREWCDRLYGGDWFSLYGTEVYDGADDAGEARLTPEQLEELRERFGDLSAARTELLSFATSYTGRIPYYWGGKPACPGYDGNHFGSTVTADYKGRDKRGLDCSGFVGWVWWSVFGEKPSPAMTTADIVPSLGLERISFDQIRPGDIGMEALPGASDNHIGYFAGFDANGRALWVHCSSGRGGVAVNSPNCFRYYYRIFGD